MYKDYYYDDNFEALLNDFHVDKHAAADLSSRTYTYEIKDIHNFMVCENEVCNKKKSLGFRYKESVRNILVNGIKYKEEPGETENNTK